MTLVRRYEWSGTPLKAGQGPAAAHLRASPPAAGPFLQAAGNWKVSLQAATVDWLPSGKGTFSDEKLSF